MTARASEFICDILESITKGTDSKEECISTQSALNSQENAEKEIRDNGENPVTSSIDAVDMYGSMVIKEVAKRAAN